MIGGGSIVIHAVKSKGSNKRIATEVMEVAWNTPFETIEKDLVKMTKDWFDGYKVAIKWDNKSYDQLASGFYQSGG